MTTYTCPNGHELTEPKCEACGLVATSYNAKTGEVYQWTDEDEYNDARDELQGEIDAAFEHQYFDEW